MFVYNSRTENAKIERLASSYTALNAQCGAINNSILNFCVEFPRAGHIYIHLHLDTGAKRFRVFHFCDYQYLSIIYRISGTYIVHPGIDAVLTYFLKKSTVWRLFDLELPNVGQVITTHMAHFCRVRFHGNGFDL